MLNTLASLIGTLLRRRIVGALQSRQQDVPQTLVYDYPSIEKLASALAKFHSGLELSLVDRASLINSAIETHVSRFEPIRSSNVSTPGTRGAVALLTGSSGGLGSFILSNLLKNDHVAMVYTLNRAGVSSINQRQRKSFEECGLDTSLLDSRKLVSLEGDLTRPDLGLQSAVYDNVRPPDYFCSICYRYPCSSKISSPISSTMRGCWISTSPCPPSTP